MRATLSKSFQSWCAIRLRVALSLCLAVLLLGIGAAVAATPGTWSQTGSMTTPRSDQLAALLATGNVLVVGGAGNGKSAEVYHAASGNWAKTSDAPFPPSQLISLRNAGTNSSVLSLNGTAAALYSPASGKWTTIKGPSSPGTAVLLANGRVLLVGDPSVVYDPLSGASTATRPRVLEGRSGFRATLLADGRVLVSGGDAPDAPGSEALPSELFDPATGAWRSSGATLEGRRDHLAVLLPNGDVLIAGGTRFGGGSFNASVDTAEVYHTATGKWTAAAKPGYSPNSLTVLADGRVLAAGGHSFVNSISGTLCTSSPETRIYDASMNAWSASGAMRESSGRQGHASVLLRDGQVLAAGGTRTRVVSTPSGGTECVSTAADVLASAELYTPTTASGASSDRAISRVLTQKAQTEQHILQTVQAQVKTIQASAVRAEVSRALGAVSEALPGR